MIYRLADRMPEIDPSAWIADDATVIGTVRLREQASVWFRCVLRGDNDWIDIGPRSNVQDGSVLHTDPGLRLVVGADCTIGHQVMLHGCTIGDGTLIGIGSIVLNGARIGRNSVVGAGALVPEGREYPDNVLLLGSPAVVKRELQPAEITRMQVGAAHYVQNAARYRSGLQPVPDR